MPAGVNSNIEATSKRSTYLQMRVHLSLVLFDRPVDGTCAELIPGKLLPRLASRSLRCMNAGAISLDTIYTHVYILANALQHCQTSITASRTSERTYIQTD